MIIIAVLQTSSRIWAQDYCEEIQLEVRVVLKLRGTGFQVQRYNHAALCLVYISP